MAKKQKNKGNAVETPKTSPETPKQGNCGDASKCCGGSKENAPKSPAPKGN
jgi:hypothetical protein